LYIDSIDQVNGGILTLVNVSDTSLITMTDIISGADIEHFDVDIAYPDLNHSMPTSELNQPNDTTTVDADAGCPPELALYAVEISLREEMLTRYKSAYGNNTHLNNDPIYCTWKTYKEKCALAEPADMSLNMVEVIQPIADSAANEPDSDSDILKIPKPHMRKRGSLKPTEKFFILTSEQVYAAKVRQQ